MKKLLSGLIMVLFCCGMIADENGQKNSINLMSNGIIEQGGGSFPDFWIKYGQYTPGYNPYGYKGKGVFVFDKPGDYDVRHLAIYGIVPQGRYRLSAAVRSSKLQCAGQPQLSLINNGWSKGCSLKLPFDTGNEWQSLSIETDGFTSEVDFRVAIYIKGLTAGSLEIADIRVEPLNDIAVKDAFEYMKGLPQTDLIPLTPRLREIPMEKPLLNLRWFGIEKISEVKWTLNGQPRQPAAVDGNGMLQFDLSGAAVGENIIEASAGNITDRWIVNLLPAKPEVNMIRKNNLHRVLKEFDLPQRPADSVMLSTFVNPRRGWVLAKLPEGASLQIIGAERALKNNEFMPLEEGEYQYTVKGGAGKGGICSIAETFIYTLGQGPWSTVFKRHDWAFTQKYMLPVFTTFFNVNFANVDIDYMRRGYWRIFGSAKISMAITPEGGDDIRRFPGLDPANRNSDGITLDEFNAADAQQQMQLVRNLYRLQIPAGKRVYSWIHSNVAPNRFFAKFAHTAINLSEEGMMLYEPYVGNSFDTLEEVDREIYQRTVDAARRIERAAPGMMKYTGMIGCHSNNDLTFTCDNSADTDYRYVLDRQMQILATAPEFRELPVCGFWGDNYSDIDQTRWTAALIKHYVIDGKTELLSPEYGITFKPGHLLNPSFRQGLAHWQIKGRVTHGENKDFPAKILQCFRAQPGKLDFYAELEHVKGNPAEISTTINNLVPGRRYKVRFVTSNADDVINGDNRQSILTCSLQGGEIEKDSVIAIRMQKPNKENWHRSNYDEFVFRANAENGRLTFSCASAPEGSRTALHYVKIFTFMEDK